MFIWKRQKKRELMSIQETSANSQRVLRYGGMISHMREPKGGSWLNVIENIHDPKYDEPCPIITFLQEKRVNVPDLLKIIEKEKSTIADVQQSIEYYYTPCSPYKITLPSYLCGDLAYLIGVMVGDGTIISPVKRKRGGYRWRILITGEHDHLEFFVNIVVSLFNYEPKMYRDPRKKNTYSLVINSKVIYRYFTRVLGLKVGAKEEEYSVPKIISSSKLFRYFLAGLFDTDGCVTARAVKISQQSKLFLSELKVLTYRLLGLEFKGPYLSKKTKNKEHWEIRIGALKERELFFQKVPLGIKAPK